VQVAWLEDFVALAREGHFSRAAQQRHVTHPAFGRRIRALEAWAGVPLVERGRTPVTLTPAGERFLQYAQEATLNLAQARDELRATGTAGQETVTLVTGRTLARTIAADWIGRARRQLGEARIRVRTGSMAETLQRFERGEAEFMLSYHHRLVALKLDPSRFLMRTVARDRLVPVVRAGSAARMAQQMAAGKPLPLLAYPETLALGRLVRDHLVNLAGGPRLHEVIECDFADALLEYATKGAGVAWLPWSLALGACRAGQLEVLGGRALEIDFEVRMARPKRRLSPRAEALWALVEKA
jgi:DNA-binding transcriptional LysR family regulator